VIGLDAEDVAVELHRSRDVVEVLLEQLGDPILEADGFRRIAVSSASCISTVSKVAPVRAV